MRSNRIYRVLVRTGQVHAIDIPASSEKLALARAEKLWYAGRTERFDCIQRKVAALFDIDDIASEHLLDIDAEDRAQWAACALKTFSRKTGSEVDAEAVLDLMADLGHYADAHGMAFLDLAARAIGCWTREHTDPDGDAAPPPVTIKIGRHQQEEGDQT